MKALAIFAARARALRAHMWRLIQGATTAQKLALAFALFLAPLAFVSGKLAAEQQRGVDIARQERVGAAFLSTVNDVRGLLDQQARAYQMGLTGDESIIAAIRNLEAAQARYGAGLNTQKCVGRALTAMRTIMSNPGARGTAAHAAKEALSDLARRIVDNAHLQRDPERASHYLISLIHERTPLLARETRDLTAEAGRAFAQRRLSESDRALLLQRAAVLENVLSELGRTTEEVTASDARFEASIGAEALSVMANTRAYLDRMQTALTRGRADMNTLIATEAGAHAAIGNLAERGADELDRVLRERAAR
nr:hypothetical protein [Terricaulis sp.]